MPVDINELVAAAQSRIREVEPGDCLAGEALVVDVREPAEFAQGHLPGAVNLPRGVLEFQIRAHPAVAEVRQTGMVVAIELHPETGNGEDGHAVEIAGRRGLRMYRAALSAGVLLRPLGDVLYWMPPYCVDDEQLDVLARVTHGAIVEATACA